MNDNKDFRSALSAFVTGVTIVTATTDDGENLGVTANSFNSVSLDPALVLVSLSRRLRSFEAFEKTSSFAINLLCREQEDLCLRFARQGVEKWDGLQPEKGVLGLPLIPGRLAHFECSTWAKYDGGDHLILVGKVEDFSSSEHNEPLVYYRGTFPILSRTSNQIGVRHA